MPADRRYTREHEWALREDDIVVVGITDFAQHELGDVVYVELPAVGGRVTAMKEFGVIESVKSASDLYSPLTGEVVATNAELAEHPELVNDSPYDRGWMIRVRADDITELDTLLDSDGYQQVIGAA
ncbi:MAG: glycine cleavage system protein GcvH [Chloroflexi bacterium]|nr:glycine cleavage system protein GcvH [Chloroflexota bacterium]